MTFPTIPTAAGGRVLFTNQADTSGTRTFPSLSSLTKNAGDLLIAIVTTYQGTTNPQFSSWGGGFTELSAGGDQGSATTMGIGVAYKISTGSETGTFTVTQAATITGHASMCLLSIPLTNSVFVPEAGTIANGTAAAADPGSFNPAGWGTEDTLWISVAVSGMTSGTGSWTGTGASGPTNYSDFARSATTDSSTVGQTEIAVAFRQLNGASEDVGAVGVDLSNARNSALIIAIPPVIAGALAGVVAGSFGAGSSVMVGAGALAGVASQTFGAGSSTLGGAGALAGAAAVTITPTATLEGQAPSNELAGAATIAISAVGVLGGSGALAGTAAIVFSHGAIMVGAGALTGTAALAFSGTPALSANGALAGASAVTFGQQAALAGAGAMAGTSALTCGASAGLDGAGVLAGPCGLMFSEAALLTGQGALAGAVPIEFALSATADLPAGGMTGVAALSLDGNAALFGDGVLSGLASLSFTAQGALLADGALAGACVMALLAAADLDAFEPDELFSLLGTLQSFPLTGVPPLHPLEGDENWPLHGQTQSYPLE